MTDYLYDSRGEPIAFRRGRNVHNLCGAWIGWLPRGDAEVVTPGGEYLGTVVGDELLAQRGHANPETRATRGIQELQAIRESGALATFAMVTPT